MTFAPLSQYLRDSALFRRLAEVVDFCTYREVREFDFGSAQTARRPARR